MSSVFQNIVDKDLGNTVEHVMMQTLLECTTRGLSAAETAAAIDAAYPFDERKREPYKAWLKARAALFAKHDLPRYGDHSTAQARMDDLVSRLWERNAWN